MPQRLLLGTQEAVVIAHTDCGKLTFTNEDLGRKLANKVGAPFAVSSKTRLQRRI